MENVIIESDRIIFCNTQSQDLDEIIEMELERDEQNRIYVYSWSKDKHIEVINSEKWMHMTIRNRVSNEIIGFVLLDGLGSEHETIELTRIVIKDKGKGYGRESLRLVKDLCFKKLGCHRLWLDAFTYNTWAISLYESEGFQREGILRDCKKFDNTYYSMLVMSILSNKYSTF